MKISAHDLEYLSDKKYTHGLKFKLSTTRDDCQYTSKITLLKTLAQNKKIIHVGCVDHNRETIERKIKKNKWLHKHLEEVAKEVIGVDIKEEEIKYIRDSFGYNVQAIDITKPSDTIRNSSHDALFLPDVIEHIGNPVDFLKNIHQSHRDNIKKIVISVPNAFHKNNFERARNDFEAINSDHRFWFTPYTISKILADSGFTIEDIFMYNKVSPIRKKSLRTKLFNINFIRKYFFSDSLFSRLGIVVIARFNKA